MTATASRTDPVRARKLAEQCFAVARSTKFEGEREAAIAKGTTIAQKAGLSLDGFDIPGRSSSNATSGSEQSSLRGTRGPKHAGSAETRRPSADEVDEMLRRAKATQQGWESDPWYRDTRHRKAQAHAEEQIRRAFERRRAFDDLAESMRRNGEAFNARPDETAYDARRRAFNEATKTPFGELHRRNDLKGRWPTVDAVINALRARRVHVAPVESRVSYQGATKLLWIVTSPSVVVLDEWSLRELADEVVQ